MYVYTFRITLLFFLDSFSLFADVPCALGNDRTLEAHIHIDSTNQGNQDGLGERCRAVYT